ncbi:squalene/phytoene synthase family protein [Micromonospora sp. b486]|uniref:squalene/phytoene synthase family protein n=1 Tax=Micromonospora sp. b486 TaxID=3053986 RepID=UPI00259CAD95|nr:squalene/phytoene synthase family protein [Micromonospora sp. b486]MDM4784691.1 squalene/phytoene synthase family protein [Micromonospora sp. b486]
MHALYGFTRYADEIVDRTEDLPPAERAARCASGRTGSSRACTVASVTTPASRRAAHHRGVRPGPLRLRVVPAQHGDGPDGLRLSRHVPAYDDLLEYMEGSAAVIGTMMLPILGSSDPAAAREPARQLGFAFQLTNFIRDVAEDLDRGRTYLPDEDMAKFDLTRDDLLAPRPPAVPRRASAS